MPRDRDRSCSRDRRSSSSCSDSSYERKKSKYKHKRRSRSRDHSTKSHKRRLSHSKSKHRKRSYSRSVSKERYDNRSKRRSSSRSRSKRSKHSRGRSRYSSRDKKHERKSHKYSRSRSRSNSYDIVPPKQLDDTDTEVEKAIKAAEAVGLTMTKIPKYEYKDVAVKEDMPTMHDRNLLDELNSDAFVQKTFTSTKKKRQNIVIDLNAETIQVPEANIKVQKDESVINFNEIQCQEDLKELWIKKLYQYRKKMLKGEL